MGMNEARPCDVCRFGEILNFFDQPVNGHLIYSLCAVHADLINRFIYIMQLWMAALSGKRLKVQMI